MDLNSAQRIVDAEAARTGLGTGPNRRLRLTLIIAMPLFLPVLGLMILVPDGLMNDVLYAYQAVIIGCLLHYLWVFVKYPRHEDRPPYLTGISPWVVGFSCPRCSSDSGRACLPPWRGLFSWASPMP
ncbi:MULTISPECIES: hypothetical protein [Streptomyces]|uniref:hypothetical protein n=1 Tax=Streptomyces sp. CC71 TaxID=1770211 RepID=UPI000AD11DBC|nr:MULTISPECIES: hypothetical protein [Streptomyces]